MFIFDGRGYNIKLGHVSYTKPVPILGGNSSYTPELAVAIEIKNCLAPITHLRFCLDTVESLFGDILMRVDATLSVSIGDGFEANFAYSEMGLPASFQPKNGTEVRRSPFGLHVKVRDVVV